MAIKQMSYLEIPLDARKKAGARRLSILRPLLAEKSLPDSQRAKVQEEIRQVSAWVAGTLKAFPVEVQEAESAPAPEESSLILPPAKPQHHVVDVEEQLSVKHLEESSKG